jgi:hypothetical protein
MNSQRTKKKIRLYIQAFFSCWWIRLIYIVNSTQVNKPDPATFLAVALLKGHDLRGYWSRLEQFYMPFCGYTMTQDRFSHILQFLHFVNN